jgi:hypothetical protein
LTKDPLNCDPYPQRMYETLRPVFRAYIGKPFPSEAVVIADVTKAVQVFFPFDNGETVKGVVANWAREAQDGMFETEWPYFPTA